MRNRKASWVLSMSIVMAVSASNCTYFRREKAEETVEPMLIAAGFKMKLADTPAKEAHLKTLPQLKMQPLHKDGKLMYIYADKEGCNCLYHGDAKAFRQYEQEVLDARDAAPVEGSSEEVQDARIMDYDVDTWDPWEFGQW